MSHIASVGRHHSRASAQARQQLHHQQDQHQQQSHSHNFDTADNNDSDQQGTTRSGQFTSYEHRLSDTGQENSSSLDRSYGGLSQISVITITSGDDDDEDLSEEMSIRRTRKSTRNQTKAARERQTMSSGSFMWSSNPIGHIKTISDIEAHIDSDLEQANAISRLEERWQALTKNFEAVLSHLQECSNEVSITELILLMIHDPVAVPCIDIMEIGLSTLYR